MNVPNDNSHRFVDILRLDDVDSTNRYLLDRAREGAPTGLVVVADRQSAGRGRLGRTWETPAGTSLLVSVLLRPELDASHRQIVVMAAALAMADAVQQTTGVMAEIKWPNDLLVGDKKLAGILAEASGDAVVVGIGVNLAWDVVPQELEGIATAVSLEGGQSATRDEVLEAFLARYSELLDDLDVTLQSYRDRLVTLGKRVRVDRNDSSVVGIAVDVDEFGHLLVQPDTGDVVTIAAGDVVHLRPA